MSDHYYDPKTGEPRHFVPKKDGSGNRPSTIRDARENNWFPSVTTILKVINKPGLNNWLISQAVQAVVTAPDKPGELLDDKIIRVLEVEKQQDQEAEQARDLGTRIHEAIELALKGEPFDGELTKFVEPALKEIQKHGYILATEQIVFGDGYAGKCDLIQAAIITDFKTCKKLPKDVAWPEHQMQVAAYTRAIIHKIPKMLPQNGGVLYISTVEPGKLAYFQIGEIQKAYEAFDNAMELWQWLNNYRPKVDHDF